MVKTEWSFFYIIPINLIYRKVLYWGSRNLSYFFPTLQKISFRVQTLIILCTYICPYALKKYIVKYKMYNVRTWQRFVSSTYRKHWKSCVGFQLFRQIKLIWAVLKLLSKSQSMQLFRPVFYVFMGKKWFKILLKKTIFE